MEEKTYTLRALKADDLFMVLRIINKIGLSELKKCFDGETVRKAIADAGKEQESDLAAAVGMQIMVDVAALVLERLPECRTEIYQFLAALSGMKEKEIAELPMGAFTGMMMETIQKEEFADFFTQVFKLRS
jgi:hypothetical protein